MVGDPLLGDGFGRHDLRDVLHPRGARRREKKRRTDSGAGDSWVKRGMAQVLGQKRIAGDTFWPFSEAFTDPDPGAFITPSPALCFGVSLEPTQTLPLPRPPPPSP